MSTTKSGFGAGDNGGMLSTKPYILRAFYDWILDNQCTPQLVVRVAVPDVKVPVEYAENGQIVLNIAPPAVNRFQMTNQFLEFETRFQGNVHAIYIPMDAVSAIFAAENGHGTVFAESESSSENRPKKPASRPRTRPSPDGKPKLRRVK